MLKNIGFGIRKVDKPRLRELPSAKVKYLAELEHERWLCERLHEGWTYTSGPRDNEKKQSPGLVPWDEVKDETKRIDIEMIASVPKLLKDVGFEITSI